MQLNRTDTCLLTDGWPLCRSAGETAKKSTPKYFHIFADKLHARSCNSSLQRDTTIRHQNLCIILRTTCMTFTTQRLCKMTCDQLTAKGLPVSPELIRMLTVSAQDVSSLDLFCGFITFVLHNRFGRYFTLRTWLVPGIRQYGRSSKSGSTGAT